MALYVIDIETDGIHSTKIHVMSIGYLNDDDEWRIHSTKDPEVMKKILSEKNNTVVGHFFKQFDVVELERVLDFKVEAEVWDSLVLAWYIYPKRTIGTFGLGDFGENYGVEKPVIKPEEWKGPLPNETQEDFDKKMRHRCHSDVSINIRLWVDIAEKLLELYGTWKLARRFIRYLMFKTDCLVHQQLIKCRIDLEKVHDNLNYLAPLLKEKIDILVKVMPPGNLIATKPTKMYIKNVKKAPSTLKKVDGTYSVAGQKWIDLLTEKKMDLQSSEIVSETLSSKGKAWQKQLEEYGLSSTTEEIREDPNPSSIPQIKAWLFSMGWKPEIFNQGANGPVPQIRNEKKELCDSILALAEKEPAISALEGFTVLNHRIATLKAFVDTSDFNGYVTAGASGFTNTLRLKHKKPIVNLPKVTKKGDLRDGQIIRECIIATDGHILCGSDISSLEDQTKRHYMWRYDPEYVTEQMAEDYDPHLDLAFRAGSLTLEQVAEHKLYAKTKGKKGVDHGGIRHIYKTANYACIYGIGIAALSRATGLSQKDAKKLRNDYWDRNWSINELAEDVVTKVVRGQMWLINPVNQYWYSVRNDKDIFSTLNQGTGAFVFDLWIKFMNQKGLFPFLQYHDEVLLNVLPKKEESITSILDSSMKKVNEILKLNIEIKVDVQFGKTYADVH